MSRKLFFVKDPNENILEIKTLTNNPDQFFHFLMKKKIDAYSETLFHLMHFRNRQFIDSKLMIGIDYETFMIMSCIGSHYIKHNTKQGSNWDSLWEQTRSKKIDKLYTDKKLTIFALANIMRLPKETVRRNG